MKLPRCRPTKRLIAAAVFFTLAVCPPAISPASADEQVYVRVKRTALRERATFLANAKAQLLYGDQLTVLDDSSDWPKVRAAGGREGYVHSSAVTDRPVVFGSGAKNAPSSVDQEEIILAGKGFSKGVEQQYARSNRGVNYRAVDEMERGSVTAAELKKFISEGKLKN